MGQRPEATLRPSPHRQLLTGGLWGRRCPASAQGRKRSLDFGDCHLLVELLSGFQRYSFFYNILINLSDIVRKFKTSPGAAGGGRVAQIPQCPLVTPAVSVGKVSKNEPKAKQSRASATSRAAAELASLNQVMQCRFYTPTERFSLPWFAFCCEQRGAEPPACAVLGDIFARRGYTPRHIVLRYCILYFKVLLVYVSRYNFRCVIRKHYLRDEDHLCFILLLTLSTILLLCLNGKIYY